LTYNLSGAWDIVAGPFLALEPYCVFNPTWHYKIARHWGQKIDKNIQQWGFAGGYLPDY